MTRLPFALLAAALAGGCAVAPESPAPLPAAPSAWQAPLPAGAGAPGWTRFDDPLLPALIDTAASPD